MTDYRVDNVSLASPDMDAPDFAALKDSIAKLGQLQPILVSGTTVYDGRKRLRACQELGIEPVVLDVGQHADASDVAAAANLLRTHYSASQRAMFAATMANMKRGDAGAQRITDDPEISGSSPKLSAAEAARLVGVNVSMVETAKAVRRVAAPEVVEAVERGHLTLHAAGQIAKSLPREEQAAKVAEVLAIPKRTRNLTKRALGGAAFRRPPKKPPAEIIERCVTMVEGAAEALQALEATTLPPEQAQEWAGRLTAALTPLRTFLHQIEAVYGKRRA